MTEVLAYLSDLLSAFISSMWQIIAWASVFGFIIGFTYWVINFVFPVGGD